MSEEIKDRIREIIKITHTLGWINKTQMLLADIEKCMYAMVDDFELNRMREWYKDTLEASDSSEEEEE